MTIDLMGKAVMVEQITAAIQAGGGDATITENVREALCQLMNDNRVQLPDEVFVNDSDQYARRLIHRDHDLGYTIMAMTWGPLQGTPIHDHDGLWCVEAVWHGQIEVVQYEMMEDAGSQVRFEPRTTMRAGPGSAGSLIPPHEYHTIANPSHEATAVTIHVYADALEHCCIFQPVQGDEAGWYDRIEKSLSLDAA